MKTKVVETSEWGRRLEVEVEAERLDKESENALRQYQRRLELPGFRKGKVPMRIVESRYGESIRNEVVGRMLPELLQEAAREEQLTPVAPPQITEMNDERGSPLTFTAELDIWPDIQLKKTEGLEVTRAVHEVSDDEVEAQLKEFQSRQASERSVERALESGDVLIADLQRLNENGEFVEDEKFEERYFVIGEENAPSPEFEEALIGVIAGEERKVEFSYRDDLPNQELAGKTERFMVSVREVRERILPDLDDEFAKDVGEQFETLEDLRSHLETEISGRWEQMSQQRERTDLISQLIEKNPFDLPESMVENYLRSMREQNKAQHQGHDHDNDHENREQERDGAVRSLKSYVLSEAVRKKYEIAVAEEEFEQYLEERAEKVGVKLEEIKKNARVDDLRRELEEEKMFGELMKTAEIKEEVV
ncbi:MAG: trigger factor [Candidatus Latescibacterota bacterium]|nr:trigger factor [Candidatus Latescibacterota bacterium]